MKVEIRKMYHLDEILKWRREVLKSVFSISDDVQLEELTKANSAYFRFHIPEGLCSCYAVLVNDEQVGCGAYCLQAEMPSPDNPSGLCAFLMNIYVRQEWRHNGFATQLIKHMVADAQGSGIGKIYLESTPAAVPLYRKCGFQDIQHIMKFQSTEDRAGL